MPLPWSIILIAAGPVKPDAARMPILWTTLALIVVLLIGALVIAVVDRWRKRARETRLSAGDQLSHFRTLYERGEVSREEFERIRARLSERLRQDLNVPGQAPPAEGAGPTPGAVQAAPPPPAGPRPDGPAPPPETGIRDGPPPA